jgi:hypothetical protein
LVVLPREVLMSGPRRAHSWRVLPWLLLLGLAALRLWSLPAAADSLPSDLSPTALIDRLVERRWTEARVTPAPTVDDRGFARRLYLDLVGRIPTPAEVDAFIASTGSDRRAALVDRLLASPEYARRLRDVFDVVFMGRPAAEARRPRGSETGDYRGEWRRRARARAARA